VPPRAFVNASTLRPRTSRCSSTDSSAKSSWNQPCDASSWPPSAIAAIDSGNASSVWPGTNQVEGIPRDASRERIRAAPTRGPNSPWDSLTGESPRRIESEIASWSNVRATVSRGTGTLIVIRRS
jgi:hypothetical protein